MPGARVEVYSAVVLAASRCLTVSASLSEGPQPPNSVVEAVTRYAMGDYSAYESLGPMEASLANAMIYGGLVLNYTCGPIAPLSRLIVTERIRLSRASGVKWSPLGDSLILKAWALMVKGSEREGLSLIAGPTAYPKGYLWEVGGDVRVMPVGFRVRV